ncbi:MAG: hypothetical protein UX87_C0007G0062 [Candidatus Amesbacteria bacterium GW2011_GWA1_47_16]|uniref:DUF2292 domain-containing protein n=4 Tax=Candidatus Amesiibacteriota TaxID=1752730 RepID=A0A0G1S4Q6_9BACT|nr:MAG: hypothetical protein UX86_C0009G0006 [Candidatus Amesbacteria bacterium GW2011_GWC1_47_15]KKU64554.1 MAG: hypothetical protein UX87_C0007G0062 [Candidatus Amesbacteria bacterium GW2011_GWA1_47_16]KKU98099.1 MAG: hypothetical protein UY28_C0008G0045 [Candidatus Amesbacteria bacterium GW2011_GWB1_48_13]OGC98800.1 MAG: hypothetical protein A2701_02430 [Candidatus Amesbacteria bacterium RIFCSPHIGHO2_01_FULL_47_34]OGD00616.1 MAG: hypothetical protein A2972_02035 [Candidatus Amesbacteria bact
MNKYSIKDPSQNLIKEIIESLKMVQGYGSLEIYVQDHMVTQITVRNIKKTSTKVSRGNKWHG